MRIVLGTEELAAIGGTQTYLVTVAEQLARLGHEVLLAAQVRGEAAQIAERRAVRVLAPEDLPNRCDAVLAQDAPSAYELAGRYPAARRVYVAHSTEVSLQLVPQVADVAAAVVVMNDRVAAHVRSLAVRPPQRRLRQPIDLQRFGRVGDRRNERVREVVVFGNDQGGEALRRIRRAVERHGARFRLIGRHGEVTATPDLELARADVVCAIGRCALEGMAARRAVYVTGPAGTDGWLTPESYEAIEADGFTGRATGRRLDEEELLASLESWSPALGDAGRELAYRHHDAASHARELVALWEELDPASPPSGTPLDELARVSRAQARAESRIFELTGEVGRTLRERDAAHEELVSLRAELQALRGHPPLEARGAHRAPARPRPQRP